MGTGFCTFQLRTCCSTIGCGVHSSCFSESGMNFVELWCFSLGCNATALRVISRFFALKDDPHKCSSQGHNSHKVAKSRPRALRSSSTLFVRLLLDNLTLWPSAPHHVERSGAGKAPTSHSAHVTCRRIKSRDSGLLPQTLMTVPDVVVQSRAEAGVVSRL